MASALTSVVATGIVRALSVRVRVVGASMRPTLADGEVLWAWRRRAPRPGDVVIFRPPVHTDVPLMVKRCTGVAGAVFGSRQVPPGHLWVVGDGRRSISSAEFGPLPMGSVVASRRGTGRLAPAASDGPAEQYEGTLS